MKLRIEKLKQVVARKNATSVETILEETPNEPGVSSSAPLAEAVEPPPEPYRHDIRGCESYSDKHPEADADDSPRLRQEFQTVNTQCATTDAAK